MSKAFRIGYIPLSKVNWTNGTLEDARAKAREFLCGLPGVEVVGGEKRLTLEDEAVEELEKC